MSAKFCQNCGAELKGNAKYCPECGEEVNQNKNENKGEKANAHENYATYTLLSVILPGVGIILGIVLLAKDKKIDKKLGEHLIAVGVLSIILWGTLYSVLLGNLFSTPNIYQ